ncbi:MAG TPA: hypothetical protein VH113_10855 [Gemmatimonadales bacterium]|nr:hypothetical protein [Gemmatimonadales bacterium]
MRGPPLALILGLGLSLAAASAPADLTRLAGDWIIQFRPLQVTPVNQTRRGVATVSLEVTTEQGKRILQGPYSLSMGGLTRPDPCISTGGTARLVLMRKDSVRIDLRQGFNCGLSIVGVVRRDTVFGRWRQKSGSGTIAQGRFTMSRANR